MQSSGLWCTKGVFSLLFSISVMLAVQSCIQIKEHSIESLISQSEIEATYKEPLLTFHQPIDHSSPAAEKLTNAYQTLPKPQRPAQVNINLTDSWKYSKGVFSEGLHASLADKPEDMKTVATRHRVLQPDSPLWYEKEVQFDYPVTLRVSADDGAQVWYGGEHISSYRGIYFNLSPASGPESLVIRVINNAMKGGLNSVQVYRRNDFMKYERYSKLYDRIGLLTTKAKRLNHLPKQAVTLILKAINKPTPENVATAEQSLRLYPYFVTPPYLQQTDEDELSILWETDLPTSHLLAWGDQPDKLNTKVSSDSSEIIHEVRLKNIEPGKTYYYRIRQRKTFSKIYSFELPADTTHFQFAIWGDSQSGWKTFDQIVQAMQSHPLQFTIGAGDLVNRAWRPRQYSALIQTLYPLSSAIPTYFVPGNHDYDGFYETMVAKNFHRYARNSTGRDATYFSWQVGNAAFIALDPHNTFPVGIPEKSDQYQWLMNQLNLPFWNKARWRFIIIHHPPFAQAWKGYHGELSVRNTLEPLIEKYQIDFIVAGHSHAYERLVRKHGKQTAHYIVTGGAGGGLETYPLSDHPKMDTVVLAHHYTHFEVKSDTILVKAINAEKRVIDQLEIVK